MKIFSSRMISILCAITVISGPLSSCALRSGETVSDTQSSAADKTSSSATDNSKPDNDDTSAAEKEEEGGNTLSQRPQITRTDETVVISQESGIYQGDVEIELTADNGSAEVYYTTDGSDPAYSETALKYDGKFTLSDPSDAPNVLSAVDPVLFCGNLNYPNGDKTDFECSVSAPSDSDVDKCAVLRVAAKNPDGSFSQENGAVYFFGENMDSHIEGLEESCKAAGESLAVINISMNYDDLFDPAYGIYVKGDHFKNALEDFINSGDFMENETARSLDANYKQKGRDWEREAYMTFMECTPEGVTVPLSQKCGVRIQGNYSRSDLQKGLRLYARKDYGDNNFNYAVFGEDYLNDSGEVMDKFKTLTLRAGGNCALTSKFNDTYWQSLVTELDCETLTSRPCVVYINGEYWGLYVLQEDYSNDYFEDLHGVAKQDVVVYKGDAEALALGYKLDEGDIPQGESESYYFNDLLEFFDSHRDLSSKEDYDEFVKLVDPQSVMDYFAVQCWINNKWDWPGKNWSMWKTINTDPANEYADGRWRFMFYDIEFGGVSGAGDAFTNTIQSDNYKPNGLLDMNTNNPAVLCFAYLMTNEDFRNDFCNELTSLSDGVFERQAALDRLQEFTDIYSPLFDQFFKRYPGSGDTENAVNGGYASAACIRDFVNKRAENIDQMIDYVHDILD